MSKITYKIALLGPSRCGKTSLISSALAEAQQFLRGTPASFTATGPTLRRIQANKQQLDGALAAGSFHSGALGGMSGTDNSQILHLSLSVGKSTLPIEILDYPGQWLTDNAPEFDTVRKWISESNILIVPVDSVIVMESSGSAQTAAAKHRLNIAAIEDAATHWAKGRVFSKSPGKVLFVPVKCESYFSDNGGRRNQSNLLLQRVIGTHYKSVIDKVKKESEGHEAISAFYIPVDTMGCVELVSADWENPPNENILECRPTFRVRGGGELKVLGAGDLLVAIAKMIAQSEKGADRGFLSGLWRYLKGEDKALVEAIKSLGERPWGSRVTEVVI